MDERTWASGDETDLLHIEEAGRRLGVSRSAMYGLLTRGEIASVKLARGRRISVAALRAFVEARTTPART